jgi:hypothetical protein
MNSAVSNATPSIDTITTEPLKAWIGSTGLRLRTWVQACSAAAEEAAIYQQLYRLSDAELERRGIPRGDLHRTVFGG